jgi:hypothetical protein
MAAVAQVEGRVTNKTGRRIAISHMALANVPRDVMIQITGHKSQSLFDRYDGTLDVAREAAMRALEPRVIGVPQLEVQYSALKDQVTKEFIEHHAVKVLTGTPIPQISYEDLLLAIKGKGVVGDMNIALLNMELEIAVYPSAPLGFYDKAHRHEPSSSHQVSTSYENNTPASAFQPGVSCSRSIYPQSTLRLYAGCSSFGPNQLDFVPHGQTIIHENQGFQSPNPVAFNQLQSSGASSNQPQPSGLAGLDSNQYQPSRPIRPRFNHSQPSGPQPSRLARPGSN